MRAMAERGFSLIELLVVLAIIAASVSIVRLGIPSFGDDEVAGQDFIDWVAQCQYESQTSGQILGISWQQDEEQIVASSLRLNLRQNLWSAYPCAHDAPTEFVFENGAADLLIDNEIIEPTKLDKLTVARADIVVTPSTGHTPFKLQLADTTTWQSDGLDSVERVDDE